MGDRTDGERSFSIFATACLSSALPGGIWSSYPRSLKRRLLSVRASLCLRSYFSRVSTGFQSRVIAAEIALLINAFRSQYYLNIMLPKRRIIARGFHR
jgi:hypothetical protein